MHAEGVQAEELQKETANSKQASAGQEKAQKNASKLFQTTVAVDARECDGHKGKDMPESSGALSSFVEEGEHSVAELCAKHEADMHALDVEFAFVWQQAGSMQKETHITDGAPHRRVAFFSQC